MTQWHPHHTGYDDNDQRRYFGEHEYILEFRGKFYIVAVDEC